MSVPPSNVNGTAGETGMTDGINPLTSPVPRLSLAQAPNREQGHSHPQFMPAPGHAQRPAMGPSHHRPLSREDGINVSFPLTIERALRFRTYAESNQDLIGELQKFGIHSIRFQGLPAKEPQWRPHPSIPAYPAPRPNVMPYQQRYINPPDDRPPSIGKKPRPGQKNPPKPSHSLPPKVSVSHSMPHGPVIYQPGPVIRPAPPSSFPPGRNFGVDSRVVHLPNRRMYRIRNVTPSPMIPLTSPDQNSIINQVPMDQSIQVVPNMQTSPMIMTTQGEALPNQNEQVNLATIDGKNHLQQSNGINNSVPLGHNKISQGNGGANVIPHSPGISSHPPIASPTQSQSILPQSASHEIPTDDSEYLNELVSKFAPAPGQLSNHQDSEKAKQSILNFLLDTKPLPASPSTTESGHNSLPDSNSNVAPPTNSFPSQSGEKSQPVVTSPAHQNSNSALNEENSSSSMGTNDADVFKKPPPPPRQKTNPT
ncbi:Oidioi.mRNA.OKI2018_I69.XSR.g15699.t1.cds [Oikopleura dioica]|uniref:Oidioi.mRNA.OKI2018_I69.XSR.g15699.t1.cds n=1 Tax=Oikopleura dioica TaxID=34765 RepID=A0ABN7SK27_OIKDI|nr:Oidioi.mRNA.OKI2018_I69.XSR.g15699.t1.cds [Oikopleura dioica]